MQSTFQGAMTKALGSLLGLWLPLLPVLYFMRKALGGGKSGAKYAPPIFISTYTLCLRPQFCHLLLVFAVAAWQGVCCTIALLYNTPWGIFGISRMQFLLVWKPKDTPLLIKNWVADWQL